MGFRRNLVLAVGFAAVTLAVPLTGIAAAEDIDARINTLYRSSIFPDMRVHVATFEAAEETFGGTVADYNRENCRTAASLFREQPGVSVLYWCEPGRAAEALGMK